MTDVPIGPLAREIAAKVEREQPKGQWRPATVVSYVNDSPLLGGVATVVFDEGGAPVQVASLIGRTLGQGDRVMIVFDPPQAAYVIGFAGTPTFSVGEPRFVFSYAGVLAVSESPPDQGSVNHQLTEAVAMLGNPGTQTVTIEIRINGVAIGTISVPASTDTARVSLSSTLVANVDFLTVAVTALGVGTAARDLTVRVMYQ